MYPCCTWSVQTSLYHCVQHNRVCCMTSFKTQVRARARLFLYYDVYCYCVEIKKRKQCRNVAVLLYIIENCINSLLLCYICHIYCNYHHEYNIYCAIPRASLKLLPAPSSSSCTSNPAMYVCIYMFASLSLVICARCIYSLFSFFQQH